MNTEFIIGVGLSILSIIVGIITYYLQKIPKKIKEEKVLDNIVRHLISKTIKDNADNVSEQHIVPVIKYYCGKYKVPLFDTDNIVCQLIVEYEDLPVQTPIMQKITERLRTVPHLPTAQDNKYQQSPIEKQFVAEEKSLYTKKEEEQFNRFPSGQDLEKLGWWNFYEPFRSVISREIGRRIPISPRHTSIGMPYAAGAERNGRDKFNNCLYRIRNTKDYYVNIQDKKKNLPDVMEIELWQEVYGEVRDKLDIWLKQNGIEDAARGKHLDANKNIDVRIVKVNRVLSEDIVTEFNKILREGYSKVV